MRRLFIPLKTEYYDQFIRGIKSNELRLEGPRWNSKTCFVGRPVVLSKGYGMHDRVSGMIRDTYIVDNCNHPDFIKLYGSGRSARIIHLAIYLDSRVTS